jgi:superfamily I DNA/RNA helicase
VSTLAQEQVILPTPEQQEAIELFAGGGNLRINAFAGAGKTTTLKMLADYRERPGLYLAFNRSAADQATERFPQSVTSYTTHSLASRHTPTEFRRNKSKMFDVVNANAVARILQLKETNLDGLVLTERSQGYLVLETLRNFLHSSSNELTPEHVPHYGRWGLVTPDVLRPYRQTLHKQACTLWEKMCDPDDDTPLGHDGYLKRWALSEPSLDVDFILLDEAQDSNPVILDVLAKQQCQIVYVGDRYQQIYEWRGAINAMQSIDTPNKTHLTESFRFGAPIAEAASRVLGALGEALTIRGNVAVESRVGPVHLPRAILCKTNAEVIIRCLDALHIGLLPHIVGGTREAIRQLQGVSSLKRSMPSDVPDFFGFNNWGEVVGFSRTPEGASLRSFVRIVEQHGEEALISALGRTTNEESRAGVVISTGHKAKGREWETVLLADDFRIYKSKAQPDDPDEFDQAELRLLYVAMTRARRALQLPELIASRFEITQQPIHRLNDSR